MNTTPQGPPATWPCRECGERSPVPFDGSRDRLKCSHCGYRPEQLMSDWIRAGPKFDPIPYTPPPAEEPAPPPASEAPPGLDDVIGNAPAVLQIHTALQAHRVRVTEHAGKGKAKALAFPHSLLIGPAGSGKSFLAGIIAHECKHKMHEHLGQSLNDPRAMVAALLALKSGDVFFIEEIHGLKKTCTETLYSAMQDRQVSPIAARGVAPLPPVRLPAFTLIGATTDQYKLTDSFKQRFQYHIALRRMTVEELSSAIAQRAERGGIKLDADGAKMIAERSHGTPRKAVMLLACCTDVAMAGGTDLIDALVVNSACEIAELDGLGLSADARSYLRVLADSAKPVRLNVLSSTLAAPPRVVEVEIERDLIWLGLIEKRPDGRILTSAGKLHLHPNGKGV